MKKQGGTLAMRPSCETCDFYGPELDTFTAAFRGAHRPLHDIVWIIFLSPVHWMLRGIFNEEGAK